MEPGQVTSPPKVMQKGPHTMIPNLTLTRLSSLPLCGQCLGSSGDPGIPGSPDTHCGAGLTRSYEHAWPALVAKGPTFLTQTPNHSPAGLAEAKLPLAGGSAALRGMCIPGSLWGGSQQVPT